ncbi:hypothetical protein M9H77_28980 [Catharanthus roseus]|uniref:Uncharacterized protein n=1 Tax=Catharanthus roseus TaxID=4058 RepID=A0ACC0AIB3_CATRO|nr:hypothetical protein M9H77_28980 [Catharanthus roseus]
MRRGVDESSTAEQSPPRTAIKRKGSRLVEHHIRKKGKLIISETEIEETSKSLTLNSCSSTTTTFSSHIYRNTNYSSYADTNHAHKKHHHKRRKPKLATEFEHRQWNNSTLDLSSYKDRVIFVSYNILGVENASKHPDLYRKVSPKYMDWDYRKQLLRKEIKDYKAGIMCLQEVDRFDDLGNLLRKDGFRGVYKARTGDACDGCAIFWKYKQFSLLHEESIEFQSFGLRNNVAQLCVFKTKQNQSNPRTNSQASRSKSSQTFVVGNIHVLFNPSRGDIKLGQMRLFLEKAQKLSQEWGSIPVVLTGDLNSMPQSAIYQFLASSELDIFLHDRRQLSGQICPSDYPVFQSRSTHAARFFMSKKPFVHKWSDEELMLASGSGDAYLRHQLKLHSAYVGVPGSSRTRDNFGEPLATSFHSKFMGTVDYIWHTADLVPVRVLELLPINTLRKMGGLPNKKWGSDHLALVCELAFTNHSIAAE